MFGVVMILYNWQWKQMLCTTPFSTILTRHIEWKQTGCSIKILVDYKQTLILTYINEQLQRCHVSLTYIYQMAILLDTKQGHKRQLIKWKIFCQHILFL